MARNKKGGEGREKGWSGADQRGEGVERSREERRRRKGNEIREERKGEERGRKEREKELRGEG